MCGIFGYVGPRRDGARVVLEGLKRLEYRGYDSWGVAVAPPSADGKACTIVVKKQIGKIGDAHVRDLPQGGFAFGHTRWATHGGVTDLNAHPHLDCTGDIAIIHNGIIENYEELKKKLLGRGHRFVSDTDTEVAAHLIEEYSKTMMFSKAVQKAFNHMEGLNAIIAMNTKERTFVAARNGSPLVVGFGNGENYFASDAAALLPLTRQVHFLEDNQMAIIGQKGVMIFDAKTGDFVHPRKQKLTWTLSQVEKGKYPTFMLKEIYEQPGIIADIAASSTAPAERLAHLIAKAEGTFMVACGTASYACIAGGYLFSKIAKTHIHWAIGSEFEYQSDFISKKSLVVALSQSGETMDTLAAVKIARGIGANVFALVNVLGSTLYREAKEKMLIGAGPEKSVASTKAFTAKIAHLILVAYALKDRVSDGQEVLIDAIKSTKRVLGKDTVEKIKHLARLIKKTEHIYIIGRGLSYPASLETALKIKEISYIHAEAFAGGELKHGVIALIEKGTPCIAFLPHDETYAATLNGVMEMKARGGYIVGVSDKPHDIFDFYIPVRGAREGTIIPNVVVGQLLAYYLTAGRGFDPDKPRNLAKSVTVK